MPACLPAEGTEWWNVFVGFDMKVDVLLSTSWLMSLVYAIKF
jgi:hypothetical protein